MPPIPIPFPENTEIYLTTISIIIGLIFEKQIQESIEHKNGRFQKFFASILAIFFMFLPFYLFMH